MRYALLAEIERRLGHPERAIQYAQEAVNASNGVERYMLVKEYERYNAAPEHIIHTSPDHDE
ncbi:hypothetical protein [Paenibacillus sp. UASWS1643]|nr:hypothetical protein [Paenibacillus sp. UASWS1643]KAA8745757.1 hypothetical protein FE296_28395 [Paenibacillus sp. UASWS1643]